MGIPNKDEIKGKGNRAKGAVKEKVGRAIGNRDLEEQGISDRAKGNIQEGAGKVRRKVGDAIQDVGKALRK